MKLKMEAYHMLDRDENQLKSLIRNAIAELNQEEKKILSITQKIDEIDYMSFFSIAKKITSYRTFWMDKNEDFLLVSAGNIYDIIATKNRYEETRSAWDRIQKKAIIDNPYKVPGTGLVALGGMSFDPKKEKTTLWKQFTDSQLHIPQFLMTKYRGNFYLTKNMSLSKNDNPHTILKDLLEKERILLSGVNDQNGVDIHSKKEVEPAQWKQAVSHAIQRIKNDEKLEKIVMAREMQLTFTDQVDITSVIKNLLDTQPHSYVFAFDHRGECFVGATPERLVKVENEKMLSTCLAGTSPRGNTVEEDEKLSHQFLNDEKNLKEHDFVVQMIRQGIEDYCIDINIPNNPSIYKLKNLQHLYTPVEARLKKTATIFDIIKQLHPTPALGGTPTEEALDFIRSHELLDRGWYGAPIGWVDSNNCGEFVVGIRSGLIQGDKASLFAGCGIVKDSDIEEEFQETSMKFLPMLNVLQG